MIYQRIEANWYIFFEELMTGELSLDKSGTSLLDSVVAYFVANAPIRAKCVFLNCEMSDSLSNFAISPDVFAVIKPIFGKKIQRVQLEVSWEAADLLTALGKHILGMTVVSIQLSMSSSKVAVSTKPIGIIVCYAG